MFEASFATLSGGCWPVCGVPCVQGHEGPAELSQGTECATGASLAASAASADACNVCRTICWGRRRH